MEPLELQLQALQESPKISPENVPLRRMVSDALLKLGRWEEAEQQARVALQQDTNDIGCKFILAQVYFEQGKLSLGLVLVEDVFAADRGRGAAWMLHSRLLQRTGNAADAMVSYRQALQVDLSLRDTALESLWDEPNLEKLGTTESAVERLGTATTASGQQLVEGTFSSDPFAVPPGTRRSTEARRDPELPGLVVEKPPYGFEAGGGFLMYGPPGCGKTHLARATAGEIKAQFISIGLHDILDMWLGNSEKQLHRVFQYARAHTPCVLFFDEVDALAASRSDMRNSAGRHTINQFLVEFDGIEASNEGVLVLAATNAPWHLDPAFRRPGRFDEIIFVPPPDADAREKILELFSTRSPWRSST